MMTAIIENVRSAMRHAKASVQGLMNWPMYELHCVINKIRGKRPTQIIISGPAQSGTTLLFDMMRYSAKGDVLCPDRESPARVSASEFIKDVITKAPLDGDEIEAICNSLGKVKDLKIIITVRDPRSLVTSMHPSIPWQYYQSWDSGFFVGPYPSFTRPGVGAAFAEIDKITKNQSVQLVLVRYEDLVSDPEAEQKRIMAFSGLNFSRPFSEFRRSESSDLLKGQLNDIYSPDGENLSGWRRPELLRRIDRIAEIYPDFGKAVKRHGYADFDSSRARASEPLSSGGIVVGMHTPDKLYRNEAERMFGSLDRLGLKYVRDEVAPAEEVARVGSAAEELPAWFVQKLARFSKPSWLLEKRKTLNDAILYCDVDAFFHKDPWPYLGLYDGDMAVFSRRNGIVNSAVIWINDTEGAVEILEEWARRCDSKRQEVYDAWPHVKPSASDQPILKDIVIENLSTSRWKIQRVPPSMLHIFDREIPDGFDNVFIEQLQASRVAKNQARGDLRPSVPDARSQRIMELNAILKRPVE